ncbi:hypothetical protein KBC04_04870 [Candidatus Babeliales bacterium]|nr:hypothetical protein [Candidatus Babeliales bacterium]MBP9844335.1 hypothetical protein [Candidatus Babeliales bacterium]
MKNLVFSLLLFCSFTDISTSDRNNLSSKRIEGLRCVASTALCCVFVICQCCQPPVSAFQIHSSSQLKEHQSPPVASAHKLYQPVKGDDPEDISKKVGSIYTCCWVSSRDIE